MKILNIYVGGNKFKKTKTEGKKKRENENSMMKAKNLNKLYIHNACCWLSVTILDASHNELLWKSL